MFPAIVLFCCIGIYCVQNSTADVLLVAAFGLFGYVILKLGFEPAPLLLGFVLGKLIEEKLRTALRMSRGSFMTFVESPLSAALLLLAVTLVIIAALPTIRQGRCRSRASRTRKCASRRRSGKSRSFRLSFSFSRRSIRSLGV